MFITPFYVKLPEYNVTSHNESSHII